MAYNQNFLLYLHIFGNRNQQLESIRVENVSEFKIFPILESKHGYFNICFIALKSNTLTLIFLQNSV